MLGWLLVPPRSTGGVGGLFIECKGNDSCYQPPQPTDNTKLLLEN